MVKSFVVLLTLLAVVRCSAQSSLPAIVEKEGRYTLLVDGQPFFVLGGQAHNSSAWPALLPRLWTAAAVLHANTLEVPVYWEQLEPQEGKFDFSLVDTLLTQARAHGTRLVLLWFATWKNGSSHYMPPWMKLQSTRYPNCVGVNGSEIDSPSPIAEATLQADKKAFAAFMRYLKQADPAHTVIMVQVENEPGAWGTVRDYSAAAQKLFEKPVPAALLKPEVLRALGHPETARTHDDPETARTPANPNAAAGSWQQVFGADADEYFQAWYVAHFIGEVAAAGKSEYPLPLYVNVALRDPLTHPTANNYESGGATDNVIPIYKAAAPAIDLVAPDIYLPENEKCLKIIDLYTRRDNPLLVPEAALTGDKVKYLYAVLAHGGIGFAPFGIDDNGGKSPDAPDSLTAFGREYALLSALQPQLAEWATQGKISALLEPDDHSDQTTDLDGWQARAMFGTGRGNHPHQNARSTGKILIIQTDPNSFLITGTLARITFKPTGANKGKNWQYLKVEEGSYENGVFKPTRILNGDETDWGGPAFGPTPTLIRITLNT
jgi:Domain of unknown function (DUF5597)/Beta-galactosidase